jgi:hypothetical protein
MSSWAKWMIAAATMAMIGAATQAHSTRPISQNRTS